MRLKTGLIIFLFSGCACFAQKKQVTVNITYTQPYCGGARPSKEIEEESRKARPYAKKKIMIVPEKGKACSAKTSATGELKLKLKPGTYKLFEDWRYYKRSPNGGALSDFDTECLKTEWQRELFVITVTETNQESAQKNDIIMHCPWAVPCLLESARPPMPQ